MYKIEVQAEMRKVSILFSLLLRIYHVKGRDKAVEHRIIHKKVNKMDPWLIGRDTQNDGKIKQNRYEIEKFLIGIRAIKLE